MNEEDQKELVRRLLAVEEQIKSLLAEVSDIGTQLMFVPVDAGLSRTVRDTHDDVIDEEINDEYSAARVFGLE